MIAKQSLPDSPGSPVLFLSGAGLPTWIWDDVRSALPDDIETAVARRPHGADATLAEYADAAAAEANWPSFVLVAHSSGGVVAAELLARHPNRVTGILGLCAVFPLRGHSLMDTMPLPARLILNVALQLVGTRPPEKVIRGLCGELPEDAADRIVADFEPESVRLYRDTTSTRELPSTRAYVRTTEDKQLSTAAQLKSAQTLGATWTEELSTGHLPMLQDPVGVASAVKRFLTHIPS